MRKTVLLILVLANVLILLRAVQHRGVDAPSMPQADFAIGAHLMMTGRHTEFPAYTWGEHLRYTRMMSGEGGWVAQVIQINDLDPAKWNAFLDAAFTLELRPVLRLATWPTDGNGHWARPEAGNGDFAPAVAAWTAFFAELDIREPIWVVVGNEPNSGAEWGGRADPEDYARYFVAVARRLKQFDRPIFIAMAALDLYAPHTNGLPFPGLDFSMMDAAAFLDGIFAAQPGIMRYVDFWASHAYPAGPFTRPPWEQSYRIDRFQGAEWILLIHPPPGIYNRGINGYEWERWYLRHVIGVDAPPVLITEFGYRHSETVDSRAPDIGESEVDSVTIAYYLEAAIYGDSDQWTPLADAPELMGVVYFALAGSPARWGHSNLLQVDDRGRVIGTYPHFDGLVQRNVD
jgi:hypothetical protein